MSKNVIWWIGVKNPDLSEKYDGFGYYEYSKKTWQHFCKRFDCEFVEFSEPVEKDMFKFRINWQKAIFVFDELERRNIDYDQICLVDAALMYKWNGPNFFELTENKFTGWHDRDNMRWIRESIDGYKEFFDNYELDQSKYISSGFIIFNKQHRDFFKSFQKLYYDNVDTFVELQDKIVRKGTEQTPLNYWLQKNDIDVKTDLPLMFKLTHMHRKELYGYNWQLDEDKTPFFIKYGYNWIFNGIPKDQRGDIMKQTWDLVKHNYDKTHEEIVLEEVLHKDTAKYTTSRKFKSDLFKIFSDKKYKKMSLLELGCCRGMTTRVYSELFEKVYGYDNSKENILAAKDVCINNYNIDFHIKDVYENEWDFPITDVVVIDAAHDYDSVSFDIDRVMKHNPNATLILDDHGNPNQEIKKIIEDKVKEYNLKIDKFIGEDSGFKCANGLVFNDREGVVINLK